ncbi:MAG: DOMON-like domain-containing protein [Allosphingosinicella sp.]
MALRVSLTPHPATPCPPLTGIEVEIARGATRAGARNLAVRFVVSGNIRAIAAPYPRKAKGSRSDDLWRHTCFEVFARAGAGEDYHEFNLAPSGDWACYRFAGYRAGRAVERQASDPRIGTYVRSSALTAEQRAHRAAAGIDPLERFESPFFMLGATLDLGGTLLPLDAPWRLGLSAVIEERNGRLSYWALAHPPGDPDFHHPDCFTLELPAARPA